MVYLADERLEGEALERFDSRLYFAHRRHYGNAGLQFLTALIHCFGAICLLILGMSEK